MEPHREIIIMDPRPRRRKELQLSQPPKIPIKFSPQSIGGVYSNQMIVSHTREEFLMDFINLFPPEGIVNARVIVSPGHLKRMIRALQDNLSKYEARFGPVLEASPPEPDQRTN